MAFDSGQGIFIFVTFSEILNIGDHVRTKFVVCFLFLFVAKNSFAIDSPVYELPQEKTSITFNTSSNPLHDIAIANHHRLPFIQGSIWKDYLHEEPRCYISLHYECFRIDHCYSDSLYLSKTYQPGTPISECLSTSKNCNLVFQSRTHPASVSLTCHTETPPLKYSDLQSAFGNYAQFGIWP